MLQLSGPTRMALEMQADKIIKNIFDSGPHSPVNIQAFSKPYTKLRLVVHRFYTVEDLLSIQE